VRVARARDTSFGSSTLELNLLEDPTAGLASGPAEELTPTELETRVRVLVSSYAPALYRLIYTPFIDVIGVLVREKLVPGSEDAKLTTTTTTVSASGMEAGSSGAGVHATTVDGGGTAVVSTSYRPVRPEEIMSRWFTDGTSTLKHPHETAEAMGKRRWAHFCRAMETHWAGMEAVMPLTRVVRRHGLREDLYLPLFRQLAMELVDPTKRTAAVATLPGFILSLANGRAPRSLGLPSNDAERIRLVSSLFLGVAQETGDSDLAYLALQLLRANNMETPFAAQKQLTNVFAAASRIETDWQMRAASLLVECYRKWLDYFREVQRDNKTALEKLEAADLHDGSSNKGEKTGKEVEESGAQADQQRRLSSSSAPPSITAAKGTKGKGSRYPAGMQDKAALTGDAGDTAKEEAAEQYRYFTSRRQDDITRVVALEENIAAAVRGRAAELQGVRLRRQGRHKTTHEVAAQSSEPVGPSLCSGTATNKKRVVPLPSREGDNDSGGEGGADDVERASAIAHHKEKKAREHDADQGSLNDETSTIRRAPAVQSRRSPRRTLCRSRHHRQGKVESEAEEENSHDTVGRPGGLKASPGSKKTQRRTAQIGVMGDELESRIVNL
jgi:hypothetical protein